MRDRCSERTLASTPRRPGPGGPAASLAGAFRRRTLTAGLRRRRDLAQKGDEAKNCQWVSELFGDVHGDGTAAREACQKNASSCESELPPPRRSTFAPTVTPSEEEECRTDICSPPRSGQRLLRGLGAKARAKIARASRVLASRWLRRQARSHGPVRLGAVPRGLRHGRDKDRSKCCRDTEFANDAERGLPVRYLKRPRRRLLRDGRRAGHEERAPGVQGRRLQGHGGHARDVGLGSVKGGVWPGRDLSVLGRANTRSVRSDICVDRDSDCCAPGEKRGCGIAGYHPAPDPTGKSPAGRRASVYAAAKGRYTSDGRAVTRPPPRSIHTGAAARRTSWRRRSSPRRSLRNHRPSRPPKRSTCTKSSSSVLSTIMALVLILIIIISIMAICASVQEGAA